jgi:F-type H+-transporting ATPase subunit delta
MKTKKQAQREARQIFQLCVVDGSLDETRVRQVVSRLVDAKRPGTLPVLTRLQRLIRLDREKHSAEVESAAPLTADARAAIEAGVVKRFGQGVVTSFRDNPALIGGVRVKVGSTVYDDTIKARLAALEEQF